MPIHKFHVGDHVEDRESGKRGVVVYVFGDLTLKDIVAVKFDKQRHAVAVSVADLKKTTERGGHDQYQHKED